MNLAIVGVIVGVLLSLFRIIVTAENPAQIPTRKITIRALFGLGNYVVLWSATSLVLHTSLRSVLEPFGTAIGLAVAPDIAVLVQFGSALVVGFGLPEIRRFKRRVLTGNFALAHNTTYRLIQRTDEVTALYWQRIIFREERNLSLDILRGEFGNLRSAIDHLWEDSLPSCARHAREWLTPTDRKNVLTLDGMRDPATKMKFMMRFYGFTRLLECLASMTEGNTADILQRKYPNWPIDCPDRRYRHRRRSNAERKGRKERRTQHPNGRRRYEGSSFEKELERLIGPEPTSMLVSELSYKVDDPTGDFNSR